MTWSATERVWKDGLMVYLRAGHRLASRREQGWEEGRRRTCWTTCTGGICKSVEVDPGWQQAHALEDVDQHDGLIVPGPPQQSQLRSSELSKGPPTHSRCSTQVRAKSTATSARSAMCLTCDVPSMKRTTCRGAGRTEVASACGQNEASVDKAAGVPWPWKGPS
jgi:hypothetical protein